MKPTVETKNRKSESAPKAAGEAPEWLSQKVYGPKRQRTVDLVSQAVQALTAGRLKISLSSISHKSKELDPTGTGVSPSAILANPGAYAIYERHRNWGRQRSRMTTRPKPDRVQPVNLSRDVDRVRQRYLKLTKEALVDRLLLVEQAHSEQEERWLRVNEELLTWQLRLHATETSRSS